MIKRSLGLFNKYSSVDYSNFKKLSDRDLEFKYSKGSGPGGQSVNKSLNAVWVKHIPTEVWVKVHESRSVERNKAIAIQRLTVKVDNYINGEQSVENQKKAIDLKLYLKKKADLAERRVLKEAAKDDIHPEIQSD